MAPKIGNWCLEDLYRKYSALTFRICLQYVKNREEAHEMVQETFLKVNRGLPDFQGLCSPMTWIHRIAVNQCLSRLERRKREREGIGRYFDERGTWEDRDDGVAADDRMEVENLLRGANQVTRRILYLSFGEGLTHSQIARSMGVSRVAVTRRITRFKAQALANRARELSEAGLAETGMASLAA